MEPFKITSPQKHTPDVELDSASGILTFSGQCYIDNAEKFFRPIFRWFDEYLAEPGKTILFEMQLDYFNTSSPSLFALLHSPLFSRLSTASPFRHPALYSPLCRR